MVSAPVCERGEERSQYFVKLRPAAVDAEEEREA